MRAHAATDKEKGTPGKDIAPARNNSISRVTSKGAKLCGDVRITFYDHDLMPPRDELVFFFWFHTAFVQGNKLVSFLARCIALGVSACVCMFYSDREREREREEVSQCKRG